VPIKTGMTTADRLAPDVLTQPPVAAFCTYGEIARASRVDAVRSRTLAVLALS